MTHSELVKILDWEHRANLAPLKLLAQSLFTLLEGLDLREEDRKMVSTVSKNWDDYLVDHDNLYMEEAVARAQVLLANNMPSSKLLRIEEAISAVKGEQLKRVDIDDKTTVYRAGNIVRVDIRD